MRFFGIFLTALGLLSSEHRVRAEETTPAEHRYYLFSNIPPRACLDILLDQKAKFYSSGTIRLKQALETYPITLKTEGERVARAQLHQILLTYKTYPKGDSQDTSPIDGLFQSLEVIRAKEPFDQKAFSRKLDQLLIHLLMNHTVVTGVRAETLIRAIELISPDQRTSVIRDYVDRSIMFALGWMLMSSLDQALAKQGLDLIFSWLNYSSFELEPLQALTFQHLNFFPNPKKANLDNRHLLLGSPARKLADRLEIQYATYMLNSSQDISESRYALNRVFEKEFGSQVRVSTYSRDVNYRLEELGEELIRTRMKRLLERFDYSLKAMPGMRDAGAKGIKTLMSRLATKVGLSRYVDLDTISMEEAVKLAQIIKKSESLLSYYLEERNSAKDGITSAAVMEDAMIAAMVYDHQSDQADLAKFYYDVLYRFLKLSNRYRLDFPGFIMPEEADQILSKFQKK